ncbi:MAG: divisome protein SepX/GlpR [Aeromicrobium sp.]
MGTGLIVAFVVAVWAAYFVPLVLRRYDEASTSSSLETLSPLSRVISNPAANIEEAQAEAPEKAEEPEPVDEPAVASPRTPVTRSAARTAARRRRRTLLTLLAATAMVGGLVGLAVVAVWSVAIPVGLVLAWLIACRVQVRAERGISSRRRRVFTFASSSMSKDAPVDEEATVIVSGQVDDVDPARRHFMKSTPLGVDALDEQLVIAAPSVATTGELVWDPLPVTLPTYVTKPRAGRTVRTIDFDQAGAWTSGHVEGEDVELPLSEQGSGVAPRRAANE